jgi:hypothetical protein
MVIGGAEDAVKQASIPAAKAKLDLMKLAGFEAVRVSTPWERGRLQPADDELAALRNVIAAAKLDAMDVYVSLLFGSRNTPLTPEQQSQFAQFAQTLATDLPEVRHYTIGNEPNLNRYWLPQFNPDGSDAAAQGYEALLAQTYDALKGVSPKIIVIGGAVSPRGGDDPNSIRLTHSPTTFIPDMGQAYRPNTTTVALADYDKLVGLLGKAFDGTAQPGSTIPIVYNEFGVEAQIPTTKSSLYTGREPATTKPVSEQTQGLYYREAIQLAFCQPTVKGFFLFHALDEPDLDRWQSGLYYANGTPKSDLATVRKAIRESRRGVVATCSNLALTPKTTVLAVPRVLGTRSREARIRLGCDIDCNWLLRLERYPSHATVAGRRGVVLGRTSTTIVLRIPKLEPGRYRFTLRLAAALNAGRPYVRAFTPFQVGP